MQVLKIFCLSLLFTILCALPALADSVTIKGVDDPNIPPGLWVTAETGYLCCSSDQKIEIAPLLETKKIKITEQVIANAAANPAITTINGSLSSDSDEYIWNKDLDPKKYLTSPKGTRVDMEIGGTNYAIYIPRGVKTDDQGNIVSVNQSVINNSLDTIAKFKMKVKEGVLAGTVATGYNIYTCYSDTQVPLGIPMNDSESGSNGLLIVDTTKKQPAYIFGASGSVNLKYTLDYFYHPLFGKMPNDDKLPKTDALWYAKMPDIDKALNKVDGKLSLIINKDFSAFESSLITNDSTMRGLGKTPPASTDIKTAGVPGYTIQASPVIAHEPKNLLDYNMPILAPSKFIATSDGKFKIAEDGFTPIGGIRVAINNNTVYKDSATAGGLPTSLNTSISDFSDLDGNSLALFKYTDASGKIRGGVVALKYKEAVIGPKDGSSTLDTTYLTGRSVVFNNNFSSNLSFAISNAGMMDIKSGVGSQGAVVRDFAFPTGADVANQESHKELSTPIADFELKYASISSVDVTGFVIIRNNNYVKDTSLIQWLSTDEAIKLKGVYAETLRNLINGDFTVTQDLSFADYSKMQVVKDILARRNQNIFASTLKAVVITFGVLLIIYSVFLILFYYVDIFNNFTDPIFLPFLTFKRLYPIETRAELDYIRKGAGDVEFVTIFGVLKFSLIGGVIGVLLLSATPILQFFLTVYTYLNHLLAGG